MTNKEKMLKGFLYTGDQELKEMSLRSRNLLDQFNQTSHADFDQRRQIAKQLFHKLGINAQINKPFYCDYGCHIEIGDHFYANFDLTILDVNKVYIGNNVMFGPHVSIYTAGHPIDKEVRNLQLEFGKPIYIEDNVWIGGNVVINPGVHIGNGAIIGSGSVVTKDIPQDVIAAGNPCRVIRAITKEDRTYWMAQKDIFETT